MKAVCTTSEARGLDRRLIDELGVPGVALMETAGRGLADVVRRRFSEEARRGVVVVCGSGNNGGDGYVAARWLKSWGFPVRTWSTSESSSGDAAVFRQAAAAAGVLSVDGIGGAGLIVDALLGTGLQRPVGGALAEIVARIDTHPAPVVAADLPTGLDADTGAVLGEGLTAACTVTFGALKRGLLCGEGPTRAGHVEVVELGLDALDLEADAELPEASDLLPLLPRRGASDHKGRAGHLLVVAGSTAMAGAAALTCRGALAGGVGLVTLCTSRGALARLGGLPPEVMVVVAGEGDSVDPGALPETDRYTALAVGPGLGGGAPLSADLERALAALWADAVVPAVYDADALVATHGLPGGDRVITPHPGEAGRMLRCSASAIEADRFTAVSRLCGTRRVALLKGRYTLVASPGEPTSVNPSGHPCLATGGSGDVLTGLIGALLARGLPARDAARLGAWLHGAAGERLGARRAEGWTASDIAAEVAAGWAG
jgi:NAD(P)H-hydrate epimerase